jgi:hypothetical protein
VIELEQIVCDESPQLTIVEFYEHDKRVPPFIPDKNYGYKLPIKGGWGYEKEDAVILDLDSPEYSTRVKNLFAYNRLDIELSYYEKTHKNIAGFDIRLESEKIIKEDLETYVKSSFNCSVLLREYSDEFYKANKGFYMPSTEFLSDKNLSDKLIKFKREYWFDITSFYIEENIFKKFFRS